MRNNVSNILSNISNPAPPPSAPPADEQNAPSPTTPPLHEQSSPHYSTPLAYEQSYPSPIATHILSEPTIPNENQDKASAPDRLMERSSKLCSRVVKVLCDDIWVACYIILLCLFITWQFLGIAWRFQDDYESKRCYDIVEDSMSNSITCGFIFLTLSGIAFCCSLCCVVC